MCLGVVLLGLAYVIGEIASIAILASHIGGLNTAGVLGVAGLLGVAFLAGRTFATLQDAAEAFVRSEPIGPVIARSAIGAAAGVLFIVPGLLSDAIALVLLIPPVRGRAAQRIVDKTVGRARGHGHGEVNVIDADAVERPGDPPHSLP